jgi:GNAT superfamily N-acetyltransferase
MPAPDIRLRPVVASDDAFLRRLYATVRGPEFEVSGWSDEQKWQLYNMQFDAQDRHYRDYFPGAAFQIIEQIALDSTIEPMTIGRLSCVHLADAREDVLLDIALLPEARGRGIGSALIESMLDRAKRSGNVVSLQVEPANPARRLYARLGFVTVASGDSRYYLWRKRYDDVCSTRLSWTVSDKCWTRPGLVELCAG